MDISVIVPCHNLELYISRCLKSILSQQYGGDGFEIIVVLDSCSDGTNQLVSEILCGRGQDKILTVNFRSPGLARNAGLDIAEGKYVWFIDGDDFLPDAHAFTKLVNRIREANVPAVYLKSFTSEKTVAENWAAWRFFYLRSFIGDIRFPDLPIDEDIKFFNDLSKKQGFNVAVIHDTMYHHTFPRKGSIVTEFNKIKVEP